MRGDLDSAVLGEEGEGLHRLRLHDDQVATAGGPALPASASVGGIAFVSLRSGQPEIHAIDKNPVWAPLL